MTTKYECDRCHEQFDSDDALLSVLVESKASRMTNPMRWTYHYCPKCSLYIQNAICITNTGDYQGSLNPKDRIGCVLGRYYDKEEEER